MLSLITATASDRSGKALKNVTGRDLDAAGITVYGPRTTYCIAFKDVEGCHEFLLQVRRLAWPPASRTGRAALPNQSLRTVGSEPVVGLGVMGIPKLGTFDADAEQHGAYCTSVLLSGLV